MSDVSEQFNFSEWSQLAIEDPAGFEKRRRRVIDQIISHFPEAKQKRLRMLQWRIDRERDRSATPMAACIRLSSMMWDSVLGEHGLLETLNGEYLPGEPRQGKLGRPVSRLPSATILKFPVRH